MTYRLLTDLAAACRSSGLRVVEIAGWQQRGRPATTGGFDPRGVVAHHTAGAQDGMSAIPLLRDGRPGLPGPLCQLGLGRDGTVYVIAAGRANHAGPSRNNGFMRAGDGNRQAIGIEAMNSGFEGWSVVQIVAYHRLCRALCEWYGWPLWHVLGHGETSTAGKWDPGFNSRMIDMHQFRTAIEKTGVIDMPLTKQEIDAIARRVWQYKNASLEKVDAYSLLRGRATPFRTWAYKGSKEKRDTYQILRDIDTRLRDVAARLKSLEDRENAR